MIRFPLEIEQRKPRSRRHQRIVRDLIGLLIIVAGLYALVLLLEALR